MKRPGLFAVGVLFWLVCVSSVFAQQTPPAVVPQITEGRLDHILSRGRLIVGVKDDYKPMSYRNAEDAIVGLEPDVARMLADRLGVDLEMIPVTSANRLGRVNSGTIDVIIATMGDTEERRQQSGLVQPNYYASGVALYGRTDIAFTDWGQMRGRPVCMVKGAYYNRTLDDTYLVSGLYYASPRDALQALKKGDCVGWAFDDVALVEQAALDADPAFDIVLPSILVVPWAMAVAPEEQNGQLGRFVSDFIAELHATGVFLDLQEKWGLTPSPYLDAQQALWTAADSGGRICLRDPDTEEFPAHCLEKDALRFGASPVDVPGWAQGFTDVTGLDLSVFFDGYDRDRLVSGFGLTFALSAVAIAGSLLVGVLLGLFHASTAQATGIIRIVGMPVRWIIVVARMTPPILQLYIVFFGVGGLLTTADIAAPSAFLIAGIILSFYAGATNAVLISHALLQESDATPGIPMRRMLGRALIRAYDGLVSTCVNIVKGAGMASVIALTELISTVNLIITEGGSAATLMNSLLLTYFLFVMVVLVVFRSAKRVLLYNEQRGVPRE